MNILSLDLAMKTGVAFGPAGAIPESTVWKLRERGEDFMDEGPNLLRRLEKLCAVRPPDVIVVEAWMSPAAQPQNVNVVNQLLVHGALIGWCGLRGIRLEHVAAATARKHVCGKANEKGREATKAMVVRTCHMLGLLPKDVLDDNRADALVCWRWAEDKIARVRGPFALVG